MRYSFLFASSLALGLSTMASAQRPALFELPRASVKLGLSAGDELGLYAGADLRLARLPIRFDADVYSSFNDFGNRSAAFALTVNYVRPFRGFYGGLGVGYIHGRERRDDFDSFATKFIVGTRIPGTGANIEGSLIWADHAIGSVHTVGTVSLVWKL